MPQTYDYWDDEPQGNVFQTPQQSLVQEQSREAQGEPQAQGGQPVSESQSQPRPASQSQPTQQSPQPPQSAPQETAQPSAQPSATAAPAPTPAVAPVPQAVYVPVQQPPQKKGRGWIVGVVLVVCLFAFAAFCVKSCTDVMAGAGYGIDAGPAGDAIAVIDISGTIQYDDTACSPEGLKKLLDKAEGNANIKGVVLRVDSGGGTATAGEEMAVYVRNFKKPIVVSSASINASAAYEISSQANYIYVAKSTEIGSIGTAMQLTDLSGLFHMLGIDIDVIASADSKDSSYGYRPLSDAEREYYQHMIDQINEVFIENVAQGRSMSVDEVRALATGLAFTGIDAVGNGLADEVGTLEDAVAKTAELAGVSNYTTYDLVLSTYDFSSLSYLLGSKSQDSTQLALPKLEQ
ncbi:MAG: signal peptide peptidase SppA [Eggerthellaceae bacterium]|nr:signal peptide peptidase SppA [Eggerthellaceae bacterium]